MCEIRDLKFCRVNLAFMSAEGAFVVPAGDFVFIDAYVSFLGGIETGLTEPFPDPFRVGEFEEGRVNPDRDNGRDSFSA
jgi:hypothetical protein